MFFRFLRFLIAVVYYSDDARLLFDTFHSVLDRRLTELSDQKQWAFWRVDNSVGTFFLQNNPTELIHPQPYDLRLSISKYGLCTVDETVSSSGKAQVRLPTIGKSLKLDCHEICLTFSISFS